MNVPYNVRGGGGGEGGTWAIFTHLKKKPAASMIPLLHNTLPSVGRESQVVNYSLCRGGKCLPVTDQHIPKRLLINWQRLITW